MEFHGHCLLYKEIKAIISYIINYRDCGHHGVQIGGQSQVKYLVMQIHYAHTLPEGEKDFSGMDLEITNQE